MLKADKIVLATPLYMSNVNAILKNLLDRMNPYYHHSELFEGKKVYLVLTGQASEEVNQEEIESVKNYFEGLGEWLFEDFEFLGYFEGYNDLNKETNYNERIEEIKNRLEE
jgi:multimeric flavodoxin WrbA